MKSVIRELYYGNIHGKNIVLPEKTRNNYDTLMRKIYKRGITTGMLLAIEAFEEGDKLCD